MRLMTHPGAAALMGLLCAIPLLATNALVVASANGRSFPWVRAWGLNNLGGFGPGFFLFLAILLLLPIGAAIALRPLVGKKGSSRPIWFALNVAVAVLLLAGFVILAIVAGEEIYRCDVLGIPNCD